MDSPTTAPSEHPSGLSSPLREFDVLIIGGGFAGVAVAQRLGKKSHLKVGLIADQNVMLFHPMLAEVCGASLSPRHIVNPIRNLCPGTEVFLAAVKDVDLKKKEVIAQSGPYSHQSHFRCKNLVIALGGVVDLSRVPGMGEHALPIKTVGDAFRIRTTVIDRLEEANITSDLEAKRRLLSFAVVGGGYSGVETAGQIADLLEGAKKMFPWLKETPASIVLIHSGPYILPQIGEKLGHFAQRNLKNRGIDIILNQRVTAVTANSVHLGQRVIPAKTVITTVGNAAHPLILQLEKRGDLPMDHGRIITDSNLRVSGLDGVWAAGDCALIRQPDGTPSPATAQFAQRQGKLVAENIRHQTDGKPMEPFSFTGLGELASIGHHNAVAKIGGVTFSGFFAWWMWRTIYLTKLPGFERKLRVLIDWTLDVIFPRDLSLLRTEATPRLAMMHLEKDDAVYSAGDPAVNFYILQRGKVEIRDDEGSLKPIFPGEYFGERELLVGTPRQLTAVATEASELLILPREIFGSLSLASPGFLSQVTTSSLQYASREEMDQLIAKVPEAVRRQKVSERMQPKVISIPRDANIAVVLDIFKHYSYTLFPLIDHERNLVGSIRREKFVDLLQGMELAHEDKIPDELIEPAKTVEKDDSMDEVLRRMLRSGRRLYFVADASNKLEGVISLIDAVID
ncbi:FAD-dependent oxidoreductase [Luteolibacter pohnpeiensis]|uniref:NADH:ubiquinone reductase (non-electrogenic) n=1 Tax=Luteolibacter pohnpeiensis TaxID=454153 RepID=A0A934S766_9BACT|nr:FAD-dependent oxidoreductase [Luteolibacter pohnpeiensis]MBK1882061.1 FAD-dependent oxidoreductase [Luteolibacter pohnpeiensis]